MKRNSMFILSAFILFSAFSCGTNGSKTTSTDITEKNGNCPSAPNLTQQVLTSTYRRKSISDRAHQISKGHVACGDYLAAKLAEYGAKVISQNAELPAYDGTLLKARNIIGSFKARKQKSASHSLRIGIPVHGPTMIRMKESSHTDTGRQ